MEAAEKVSITLTPEQLRQVRQSVEKGEYASTSEAIRDALRIWSRDRAEHEERLNAIRARIKRSLDDPRPGVPIDEAFARIEALARADDESA
jgi:antitoxin ParD1/3/4